MKRLFFILSLLFYSAAAFSQAGKGVWDVFDFGAKGDGKTLDTKAIQSTIDKAAAEGGGIVLFPAGQYLSGSIVLKDNIFLRFETGSVLLGSLDMKDYPSDLGLIKMNEEVNFAGPLIYAENARYIGLEGNGIIDGRGTREHFVPLPPSNLRPGLIRFKNCKFVTVRDVTMRNSARWTFHLRGCEDVTIRDIRLNSNVNRNNDGIDIDGGARISIVGCNINAEDDAIVLKSFTREKVTDIVIADCILSSTCSAIKIGTETVGDFENISIGNCVIYGSRGINLFSVDGSDINNVVISNISMRDCKSVFQLRLGDRLRPYEMPNDRRPAHAGRLRNIMIRNIQATGVKESQDFISGIPGYHLENIDMSDISISYFGAGTHEQALHEIPEATKTYPKIGMFGDLPCYGFFVRHVKGIRMHNIQLHFVNPDLRPALVFDDVSQINLSDCLFEGSMSQPLIRLHDVHDAFIGSSRPMNEINAFVAVTGRDSDNIILKDNILTKAKKAIDISNEVNENGVKVLGNV